MSENYRNGPYHSTADISEKTFSVFTTSNDVPAQGELHLLSRYIVWKTRRSFKQVFDSSH